MPRRIVIAACILAIAVLSNTDSFALVFARAAEGLGVEVSALGGFRTIENAASIAIALLVAPMVDRIPRKWLLLSGFGHSTVAVFLLISLNNVVGVVLFFALNGAGITQVFASLMAMPSDFVSGRQLNRLMGLLVGCIAITSVLVAPVVGFVADARGWQAGMLVSASVTGVAFLLTLVLIPRYETVQAGGSSGGFVSRYKLILARRNLLLILGSNVLRFAQLAAMMTFLSTILIRRYDMSLSIIGIIFAVTGLTFFTASLLSGIVLHWIKTWRVLIWGGFLATLLLGIMLIAQIPIQPMLVCIVLFVAVVAAQENSATIAALRLAGNIRGAAMSWNELAVGVGSMIGIGLGSAGLALAGIAGLGVALTSIALCATLVSYVALTRSGYTDESQPVEPTRASIRA